MDFLNDIESCLLVLQKGGLILYPTDTIWGIGCDATNANAVQKIYGLKQRSDEKSMIVLMADERDVLKYVTQPDLAVFDYLATVSKPTTVIYEGAIGLAENLINRDGSIAVRLVADEFCRHLLKRFRKPIVSTSANISGFPAPAVFNDIGDEIKLGVDHIVEHRRNDTKPALPSAVIKWGKEGKPLVLRS